LTTNCLLTKRVKHKVSVAAQPPKQSICLPYILILSLQKPLYFSLAMRLYIYLLFFFTCFTVKAQISFITIVPTKPVALGESFQVQYVLSGAVNAEISKPSFPAYIRLVAGPTEYTGSTSTADGVIAIKNIVYTVEAERKGVFRMPTLAASSNGKIYYSNLTIVTVASKEEIKQAAAFGESTTDYFLKPGEDPYKKIRQNLFVKVAVNKKSCYVGEPVLATFKLYSRLESKSDIAKNPGFYGFSVYDMENLQDKIVAVEKINGRLFDVHTIRKVQLYPLQSGLFTIDEMQIANQVAFSKSAVNKKTEQEISEGILGSENDEPEEGTETYDLELRSGAIDIIVKPIPEKNKTGNYNGAVGRFSISMMVVKKMLAKNEEGFLELKIKGKGNFVQLNAPVIQWPAGVEGFEPVVKDSLDKTMVPLTGSRTFRYGFVCANAGTYNLPSVSFSFFDTDSNGFKTVSTAAVQVTITNEEKKNIVVEETKTSITEQSEKASRKAIIIVVALVILILLYQMLKKKPKLVVVEKKVEVVIPTVKELMEPVYAVINEDHLFYAQLQKTCWVFLSQRFHLSGSTMNKQVVKNKMATAGIAEETTQALLSVLEKCENGIFTAAQLDIDKQNLLQQTNAILESIESVTS
jgi:BatD DUF11 like domain